MKIYKTTISFLMWILFLFGQQPSFAGSLPVFNPESILPSDDFRLLSEAYRVENFLVGKTNNKTKKTAASKKDFDIETLHKYSGYTSVFLAGLTAISNSNKGIHYGAAYSTVAASLTAVTTGYIAHGDRFTFEYGIFTEDNNHILLGALGATSCLIAVILADSDGGNGHDGLGVTGGISMAFSVVTIRW